MSLIKNKIYPWALLLLSLTTGCSNKELWYGGGGIDTDTRQVQVSFKWGESQTIQGTMRINLFSQTAEFASYGVADFAAATGGEIKVPLGASYFGVCYSYDAANKIYFRNESDPEMLEAYTASMTRGSYTRQYSTERTVGAVSEQAVFYIGRVDNFRVTESDEPLLLSFTPENVLHHYTFEIKNVIGAQFIRDLRAACSGMSPSYYVCTGELSPSPATLFFSSTANVSEGTIAGSFRSFGRLDMQNVFTLEVLTGGGKILQYSWDVTNQLGVAGSVRSRNIGDTTINIVIDDTTPCISDPDENNDGKVEVPNDGNQGSGSGFTADVDGWEEETINLN
jgi:hypothetical protein